MAERGRSWYLFRGVHDRCTPMGVDLIQRTRYLYSDGTASVSCDYGCVTLDSDNSDCSRRIR